MRLRMSEGASPYRSRIAFREVGRRGETHGVGNLRNRAVGGEQQSAGLFQAQVADKLNGGVIGEGLDFA